MIPRSFFPSKSQKRAQVQKRRDESFGLKYCSDYESDQSFSPGASAENPESPSQAQLNRIDSLNNRIKHLNELLDSLPSKPASDSSKPSQENIPVTGYKPQRKRILSKSVSKSTAGLESQLANLEEETREKLAVISKPRAVEDEKTYMVEELKDQLNQEKIKRKEDAEKARLTEDNLTRKTSELNWQLNQEKINRKSAKDQLDKTTTLRKDLQTQEKKLQDGEKKLIEEKAKYEGEKRKLAQEKLDVEKERINMQKMKIKREEEENKEKQKMLRSLSNTSKTRYAFLVANTYVQSTALRPLPGTEKSIQTVDKTLKVFGFKTKLVLNKDFDELTKELENWKLHCSKDADLGALLFYFCGHGGHLPFKSDNNAGDTNSPFFYGSTGSISLGGDFILDNNNNQMFKDTIQKALCQVYLITYTRNTSMYLNICLNFIICMDIS